MRVPCPRMAHLPWSPCRGLPGGAAHADGDIRRYESCPGVRTGAFGVTCLSGARDAKWTDPSAIQKMRDAARSVSHDAQADPSEEGEEMAAVERPGSEEGSGEDAEDDPRQTDAAASGGAPRLASLTGWIHAVLPRVVVRTAGPTVRTVSHWSRT